MTNIKLNLKSKIIKYKKEIGWLLKEKYHIDDVLKLEYLCDVILSGAKNPDFSKPINPAEAGRQYTNTKINSPIYEFTNLQTIQKDIKRILNGEPVDYVIGFKEFLNCKIDLSLKPLIPRAETEYWVSQIIADCKLQITDSNILDLCCGSGCIGITLLKNVPNCNVTFADLSEKALKQTEKNLKFNIADCRLQITDSTLFPEFVSGSQKVNYELLQSDLFEKLGSQKFDYIFTNPPYVRQKDIKGSLKYEPELALAGKGEDGLEIIYKILEEFPKYLNSNGKMFLEFGFGQKLKIEKKIKELGYKKYDFKKDQFRKYRVLIICL